MWNFSSCPALRAPTNLTGPCTAAQVLYWVLQGVALLMMIVRLLGLVSFQKRMAIIPQVGAKACEPGPRNT